jgi:uncharacterized membrane protein
MRYLMAILYIAAGIYHFIHPAMYIQIMPVWLPWHAALVFISGVAEIACGLLVCFNTTKRAGAWLTIALLVAVFPANIQMLQNYIQQHHPLTWVAVARLPVQFLLIAWAWQYTRNKQ